MRKLSIGIAGHVVEMESDQPEDTLEEMGARALGLIEETKVAATQIRFGFDVGGMGASYERPLFPDIPPVEEKQ